VTDALAVAVIDDDEEGRARLCAMLEGEGLQVVASSAHGMAHAAAALAERPQIFFVSFEYPVLRCVQTVDYFSTALPGAPILAYAHSEELSVFQQAIRAGARHLLHAPVQLEDARRALNQVTGGGSSANGLVGATGRVISIVGQKGGIGKTALSVNIASSLARDTRSSVLIIDFDTTFGDVGLTMDTNSPATVAQAAQDLSLMDRSTFKSSLSEHESGAFVLSAPAHVGEWMHVQPAELEALVEVGASLFDFVVVDTPGAYNDAVAAAISVSDNLLIVTSLEVTSVKNTSILLNVLEEEGYPVGQSQVVVNNTVASTGLKITDTPAVLERTSLWNIPYEPAMRHAATHGLPLVLRKPDSPASESMVALAKRLAESPNQIDRRASLREQTVQRREGFRARLRAALSRTPASAAS
jgi:pilus assembly protein CpaE